jgi:membrane protease subunit (stomatin/prohibitin family)
MYTLHTENMPILSTLKGWKYGFSSPFKAEVYFIATRRWTDLKWGTQNPIMLRDPEFGPVRVRAFGSYAMQVTDPGTFLRQIVATDPSLETYEITAQLRNTIVARFVDAIGQAHIAVLDLAGNYDRISQIALERIRPDLAQMGLQLASFYIENISMPPEVEAALDKRTQMGVLGDLNSYTKFQAANAIGDAAKNPGGMGAVGAQMAAGLAVGQQMAGAMASPGGSMAPPPLPASVSFFVAIDGKQAGPYDLNTLAGHAHNGLLTRSSLVWRQGMAGWVAAETVPDLQNLFGSVPPPLPPPVR